MVIAAELPKHALFGFVLIAMLACSVYAQTCKNNKFTNNIVYSTCTDLAYLNSFLHWSYDNSSKTVQIAYRHTRLGSSRWVAWAVNPTSANMSGAQAFVAYQLSNGSLRVYKSPIADTRTKLEEGQLSFPVTYLSATYSDNAITIFATFEAPNNSTTLNQLWQEGPITNDLPSAHITSPPNVLTMATVDLLSGETQTSTAGNSKQSRRNVHGVLNAVSWGIMMPIGAMIARYLKLSKSADPAWYYIHVGCQASAYIIGVAGWATGMKLGSDSPGIQYTGHRNIGITLFVYGTLQVLALLLRPNKEHKYRKYWNYYHHGIGYAVVILSIVNIFKGFNILVPNEIWKTLYIIFIAVMACIALVLELTTWWAVRKRNRPENPQAMNIGMGNGVNRGYAYKPQSTV